ncbi:uncharacterized protein LOC131148416 [Malania oleifera]|uniref:uncharacterized protein LOC131148416 n=1 Tax=Malania oleifera TaxID=397392 RepID=UPI0025AEB7AD|nr:uncharacterized protein LOC131148416 [Malania oleifera]
MAESPTALSSYTQPPVLSLPSPINMITDQAIISVLISSLSETLIAYVLTATSSREVWTTLEDLFAAKSYASIMQIQLQLTTLKKGSETIPEYYRRAKLLQDSLAMDDKLIPSSDFITYLLDGLGSDYDSLVTSITTRVDPLTPAQVYSHLLTHEARLNHQSTTLTTSPEFFANTTQTKLATSFSRIRGFSHARGNFRGGGRGGRGRHGGHPPSSNPAPFSPN